MIAEKAFEAEIQGAFELLKGTPFEGCLTHPLKKEIFPAIYSADPILLEVAKNIQLSNHNIRTGTIVTSNAFPAPKELFEKIKNENPYSIDMETSAFYQVAWLLKIPVLAIRGISNILNKQGADDKMHEADVEGSAKAVAEVVLKVIESLILKLNSKNNLHPTRNMKVDLEVKDIVEKLKLQPHPEGGYYARSFQSTAVIKSIDKERYHNEERSAGTAIYYLLKGNDFSAWHCLKSDEIWHYYKGSSVNIHVIDKTGKLKSYLLGDPVLHEGANFQVSVNADCWFAAEITDKTYYCLVGCTVSPGFDFKDFKLADRNDLSHQFPKHKKIITQFTRSNDHEQKNHFECEKPIKILSRI